MEEYLKKLVEQVRFVKARPYIEKEIRAHIDEQTECNISEGMDRETAEIEAVKDMGDPIETGIALDRVHRPTPAWGIIALIICISIVGIIIHSFLANDLKIYKELSDIQYDVSNQSNVSYAVSVFIGLAVMVVLYFVDYAVITKYAKWIGSCIILMAVLNMHFGVTINGANKWLIVGNWRFSMSAIMTFYVPVYAGILYQYRQGSYKELLKCIAWLVGPVFLTLKIPCLIESAVLYVVLLIQLSIAVSKGWFKISKKICQILLWGVSIAFPVISLVTMYFTQRMAAYQIERIKAFLSNSGDANYVTAGLRNIYQNISLIGGNTSAVMGYIPNLDNDMIFTYISSSYGILAGIVIACLIMGCIMLLISSVSRQKNELGIIMGYGCAMVLFINTVLNIMENTGLLPYTSSFLPFISKGQSNIILCYGFAGIILSIYRYKNIYPQIHVCKKSTVHR